MRRKVLIIDDDEKSRKLLRIMIRGLGYETIEAEDGEQGVRLAREKMPDLILMDMRMPVMDGIEAAKLLKVDPLTSDIPIIATTASAIKGDRERIMLEAGCNGYMSKPIDVRSFMEIVKKYMGVE
jgi:CheY-like chemotaxis protein